MIRRIAGARAIGLVCLVLGLSACTQVTVEETQELGQSAFSISGGVEEPGFPAVGALVMVLPDGTYQGSFCTATLIAPNWILTAAHCIAGAKGRFPRRLGEFQAEYLHFLVGTHAQPVEGAPPEDSQIYPASRIIVHPAYEERDLTFYDVALVELANAVPGVTPIPMRRASLVGLEGIDIQYVGFGVTNGANGEGGGTKRSIVTPLLYLNPVVFVTDQPLGGVCFGDSGGPALRQLPEEEGDLEPRYETIGVNSAGGGAEDCIGGFSLQVRVDTYMHWIDHIMSGTGGCQGDADCFCEGVCGDDGLCDNALCGEAFCANLVNCLNTCRGRFCQMSCIMAAQPDAYVQFSEISDCVDQRCPERDDLCVNQNCAYQLRSCFEGVETVTGPEDCPAMFRCRRSCVSPGCGEACIYQGTREQQEIIWTLDDCIQRECGDAEDQVTYDVCVATQCRRDILRCLPPDDCAIAGGDCEDGETCVVESWGATYCVPGQGMEIGGPCAVGEDDCVDGAVCVAHGDEGRCAKICVTSADCADDRICERIGQMGRTLPLGICGIGCLDDDGDGVCNHADCAPEVSAVHPGAEELCDGTVDEDCDGVIDEACEEDPCAEMNGPGCDGPDSETLVDAGPTDAAMTPPTQEGGAAQKSGCDCSIGDPTNDAKGWLVLLGILGCLRRRLTGLRYAS